MMKGFLGLSGRLVGPQTFRPSQPPSRVDPSSPICRLASARWRMGHSYWRPTRPATCRRGPFCPSGHPYAHSTPSIMSTSPLTKASVRAAVSVRNSSSSRSIFGLPPQYRSNARADDLLLRLVADELEWPGADRVEPQLVAELLDRLAALHVAAEARHAAERVDERVGLAEMPAPPCRRPAYRRSRSGGSWRNTASRSSDPPSA